MAFNKTAQDAHSKARQVMHLILEAGEVCETAKAQALTFNYPMLVSIPAIEQNFRAQTDAIIAEGYDGATLAPIIADIFNVDTATFIADFTALKTAFQALSTGIVNNATDLLHSIDASGGRVYDQPLTAPKQNALVGLLDDVLVLFS